MPSNEDYENILDALEVGLEGVDNFEGIEKPTILPGLMPPSQVRAVVNLEGTEYIVTVEPRIPAECPTSTHGRHTYSAGKCIGCGEKQQ